MTSQSSFYLLIQNFIFVMIIILLKVNCYVDVIIVKALFFL